MRLEEIKLTTWNRDTLIGKKRKIEDKLSDKT